VVGSSREESPVGRGESALKGEILVRSSRREVGLPSKYDSP
jgi:hypothetical protein